MSKKVVRNLLGDEYPEVRKEVEDMMGGKVLDFEAKRIKDQAIKESLGVFIATLKELSKDFEEVCNIVLKNELYKDITREQVKEYYQKG